MMFMHNDDDDDDHANHDLRTCRYLHYFSDSLVVEAGFRPASMLKPTFFLFHKKHVQTHLHSADRF